MYYATLDDLHQPSSLPYHVLFNSLLSVPHPGNPSPKFLPRKSIPEISSPKLLPETSSPEVLPRKSIPGSPLPSFSGTVISLAPLFPLTHSPSHPIIFHTIPLWKSRSVTGGQVRHGTEEHHPRACPRWLQGPLNRRSHFSGLLQENTAKLFRVQEGYSGYWKAGLRMRQLPVAPCCFITTDCHRPLIFEHQPPFPLVFKPFFVSRTNLPDTQSPSYVLKPYSNHPGTQILPGIQLFPLRRLPATLILNVLRRSYSNVQNFSILTHKACHTKASRCTRADSSA